MRISDEGLELIKSFEGCRLKAYQDSVGVWTIGYGSTKNVHPGQTITQEQAEELLRQDVAVFEQGVSDLVKVNLEQHQFDALVSFAFNLGLGNLKSSTLLRYVNMREFDSAAAQFGRWNRAGGKVLPGLTTRRKVEADLFAGK